jgi:hypothetical protein
MLSDFLFFQFLHYFEYLNTIILVFRHEKVQENCIDLVGRIADRGAEYVSHKVHCLLSSVWCPLSAVCCLPSYRPAVCFVLCAVCCVLLSHAVSIPVTLIITINIITITITMIVLITIATTTGVDADLL